MSITTEHQPTEKQLDQASDWYARLKSDQLTDQDRIAFSKWLSEDRLHQLAYTQIEQLWEELAIVSKLKFDRQAKAAEPKLTPQNTGVALNPLKPWGVAAIPAILIITISLWVNIFANSFKTDTGEQRTIHLDDGSMVYLNTNSALSVNINKSKRILTLKYGEAFFDVAHDPTRPFIVNAGNASVKAVGTAFDVYYKCDDDDGETVVTVVEGKVSVQNSDLDAGKLLKASEQARISQNTLSAIKSVNPQLFTSWKDQKLIYDGAPLFEVVKDINRYTKDKIKVSDEQLMSIPVSAVFKIQDQETILKTLEETFNLKAIRVSDSVILLDKIKT